MPSTMQTSTLGKGLETYGCREKCVLNPGMRVCNCRFSTCDSSEQNVVAKKKKISSENTCTNISHAI